MTDLTIIGLAMLAAALVSTPPLFVWCVRDVARREVERRRR